MLGALEVWLMIYIPVVSKGLMVVDLDKHTVRYCDRSCKMPHRLPSEIEFNVQLALR